MKHKLVIATTFIACLALSVGLFFFFRSLSLHTIEYSLEGKKLHLLTADSPSEQAKGLMYYRTLPDADGMIFRFKKSTIQYFWNKNTYMDLDVYWINGGKVVGKSYLPSIEKTHEPLTISSPGAADTVIEIPR